MSRPVENSGIANFSGNTTINGPTVVGTGAIMHVSASPEASAGNRARASVGVVTVLAEEAAAVRSVLGLEPSEVGGLRFDVGAVQADGRLIPVTSTRALAQGQESALAAHNHLREHFDPAVVVLAGIAGGIHREARLGDVVVATRIICYDLRKETRSGTVYRGQERQAPAVISRAVNEFFTAHGEPAEIDRGGPAGTVRVLNGPIGSGNAVVASRDSGIRAFLAGFNDKILAVDMEAAGFSQAYHEDPPAAARSRGWLVVRGISDDASPAKNDDFHHIAARNAALVLRELIRYLPGHDQAA